MDYSRFRGINPLYLEKLVNSRGQPRSGEGIFNKIKTAPPREGKALLTQLVHECAASVLGVESIQSPDPQVPLMDQGFDSLRAVEFRDLLGKKLDIPLPATLLFNYPTIVEVVVHIQGIMGLEAALPQSSVESKNRTNNEFSHLDNLSRDQLEKLISRELEAEI